MSAVATEALVTPDGLPLPPGPYPEAFEGLGLIPEALAGVQDMGFEAPMPIQRQAIPVLLRGRDLIGSAQTGTGKTAAFALPILQRLRGGQGLRALVLTPTRELAAQVTDHFRQLGRYSRLKCAVVYGGVDYGPQVEALRAGPDILVATPGRLLDHYRRRQVNFKNIQVLVLDEADRMLDMGFAEEIDQILALLPAGRQTCLFSATIPPNIMSLASKALRDSVHVMASPPASVAEGVLHAVFPVAPPRKISLLRALIEAYQPTSALIFTRTKVRADQVGDALRKLHLPVARTHSDRTQLQREQALAGFREGRFRFLVATDVASRGLDVEGISHVINHDVPENPEDYVHRAGRTARAGATGYAFTLMSPGEVLQVQAIERLIGVKLPRLSLPGFNGLGEGWARDSQPQHAATAALPPQRASELPRLHHKRSGLWLR